MKTYFFHLSSDDSLPGVVFANIVSEHFWKRNGYMADQTPTELHDILEPHGLYEAMESVFEFEGTPEEAEKILTGLGFQHNDEFSAFMEKVGK